MKILIAALFVFLAPGLYLTLVSVLRLPSIHAERVMKGYGSEQKGVSDSIDAWLSGTAVKLSRIIRINEFKRIRLEHTLKAAGIEMTPEEYKAHAILKAALWAVPIIPMFFLFPLANIVFILLVIMTYFRENGKAENILKEKREKIEGELYRFVSTIAQELKNTRDVLSILEHYRKNAGPEFRHELDILVADMRSSSYEGALERFDARLNSPKLSDIVGGLMNVLNGDDGVMTFQMLQFEFKQAELQRLKAKAAKIPPKIRIFSFVMLACYVATFFVIIFYEIIGSLSSMF